MKKRYQNLKFFNKKWRLFILFTVLGITTGSLAVVAQLFAAELFNWESSVQRIELDLPFKAYIDISVTSIPLTIETYDGDSIKINYLNESALHINETEYRYMIVQDSAFSFSLFSLEQLNYGLKILLPKQPYHSISIATASGNQDLKLPFADDIYITSGSGDIKIDHPIGEVTIKTAQGDVDLSFDTFEYPVNLESISGNFNIVISENCEFLLDFYSEQGYFFSTVFDGLTPGRKQVLKENFRLRKGTAETLLEVKTISGNLDIVY